MTLEERIEELERITGAITEVYNTKMDLDAHNIQTPSAVVIETQMPTSANNYTWYRKYSDGWVEQGGEVLSTTATNQNITISLPITMSDNHYFACSNTTYTGNDAPAYGNVVKSKTTTTIVMGHLTNYTTNWQVSGVSAE